MKRSPQRTTGLILGTLSAALLLRARRANHALAREARALHTYAIERLNAHWPGIAAHSVFFDLPAGRLHAVVAGPPQGPVALLLHGFPECWYTWRHQIPFLALLGYRVVAPDLRGYNLSFRPTGVAAYRIAALLDDLHALLDALGSSQVNLIGHDWGGVLAWHFAMQAPRRLRRLVILNAPHPALYERELRQNPRQRLKSWYALAFQLPWLPEALLGLSYLTTARLFFHRTAVRPEAFSEEDLRILAAAWTYPGALTAMLNWYRAALRHPWPPPRRIDLPTLVLWGEQDVALDRNLTRGLHPWVPHLWLHTLPHVGHWIQAEDPKEVNAALLAFLGEAKP